AWAGSCTGAGLVPTGAASTGGAGETAATGGDSGCVAGFLVAMNITVASTATAAILRNTLRSVCPRSGSISGTRAGIETGTVTGSRAGGGGGMNRVASLSPELTGGAGGRVSATVADRSSPEPAVGMVELTPRGSGV